MPRVWVKVLCSWGVSVAAVQAVAIEFIPREQIKNLESDFSQAKAPRLDQVLALKGKKIACDMYGARTRLQVERDVNLYHFDSLEEKKSWVNLGEQIIREYRLGATGLVGRGDRVADEIRFIKQDEILARLTLAKDQTILAYSRCQLRAAL